MSHRNQGSAKRVRRIKWRQNTPLGVWLLFAVVLLMFLFVLWWAISRPAEVLATRGSLESRPIGRMQ